MCRWRWPVLETSLFYSFHVCQSCVLVRRFLIFTTSWTGLSGVNCLLTFLSLVVFFLFWEKMTRFTNLQASSHVLRKFFLPYPFSSFYLIITIFSPSPPIDHSFIFAKCGRSHIFIPITRVPFKKNAYFNAHVNKWNKHTLFHTKNAFTTFKCVSYHSRGRGLYINIINPYELRLLCNRGKKEEEKTVENASKFYGEKTILRKI